MLNQYPLWKNLLILFIVLVGALYALPNLYGTDPALQIVGQGQSTVDSSTQKQVMGLLDGMEIPYRSVRLDKQGLLVRFNDVADQLKATELVRKTLGSEYTVAQNIASAAPGWLVSINALPMYLGLDLRGGLYFLMEVDTATVLKQAQENYVNDIRTELRKNKIRGAISVRPSDQGVALKFRDAATRDKVQDLMRSKFSQLFRYSESELGGSYLLQADLTEARLREMYKAALQQNITTLRNRVNLLGVAEPVIQQQGNTRIVVQLPGIQDSAHAKKILSATASLEFRLVDIEGNVQEAVAGRVPATSRLYYDRKGQPILLKKRVITTGEHITNASSGYDQDSASPAVFVNLDGAGGRAMAKATKENLGKPMAVVFIEFEPETRIVDGEEVTKTIKKEKVINVATIRGVFSRRFQVTGLNDAPDEAHNLALLLRAGALAAPIRIIEERTIGPTLGAENIQQGFESVVVGMILVVAFMVFWYRGFGLVADLALTLNLVLIVAVLSMLQATLTLPGIAGIVLTVGMAVDANVLIFERIREELRVGNTPQSSIHAGYSKALSTIADANITTLIAAVTLFIFGTGPIKGFAITLSIGIVTSMFTAIMVTRAVINLFVKGRKLKTLAI